MFRRTPDESSRIVTDNIDPTTRAVFDEVSRVYPNGVPNLFRTLAINPQVLSGFVALDQKLMGGVLTEGERMIVALLTALEADCPYCVAAMSTEAVEVGAAQEAIEAALSRARAEDRRMDTLLTATRRIMETKGRLPRAEIAWFESRGIGRDAMLEIIAVIAEFTMASYANNLLRTRIDPEYRGHGH